MASELSVPTGTDYLMLEGSLQSWREERVSEFYPRLRLETFPNFPSLPSRHR
jgi:hypothetical protein